jgi:hypothetical protein
MRVVILLFISLISCDKNGQISTDQLVYDKIVMDMASLPPKPLSKKMAVYHKTISRKPTALIDCESFKYYDDGRFQSYVPNKNVCEYIRNVTFNVEGNLLNYQNNRIDLIDEKSPEGYGLVLNFSEIYYNSEKDFAMVYVIKRYSKTQGNSSIVLLKKQTAWRVVGVKEVEVN